MERKILILIRIIAFFIYKNENKLKSKGNQKEGIIYEIGHVKGNHSCRFRFNHDAKIILGSSGSPRLVNTDFNKFKYNLDSLIGYKFRVYYDPKDPENNYMDFNVKWISFLFYSFNNNKEKLRSISGYFKH